MMFPIKNGLGSDKAQMAEDIVIMLRDGLSLTEKFLVWGYDLNSNVSIQRAVTEQKIKEEDVKTAFSTDAEGISRAQKVCQAIAVDIGVIGSLDSYSFDVAQKQAKIGVTIQVLRGPVADPVAIVVTGIAAGKIDDQSQTESGIALAALDDASDKVLSKLVEISLAAASSTRDGQTQVYRPVEKPKSHSKGLLPAMLVALLLGLALGGN
jgi:hypothetical protein